MPGKRYKGQGKWVEGAGLRTYPAANAAWLTMGERMFDEDELVAIMQRAGHFSQLSAAEVRAIVQAGQLRQHGAGEVIFGENEPCAGLFVLLAGHIELCKHSLQGQKSIMALMDPAMMFNEVATLDGGPNPATAIAVDDVTVWVAGAGTMRDLILRHPMLGLGLLRVLARRNRLLTLSFEDLSFRSVMARTARLLLRLSEDGGQAVDRRQHPNYQLAALVSTVPEAFSRSLRLLREAGLVGCTAREITVLDVAALSNAAQTDESSA
jgi:CRP/FNR family transcriptional regulator